MEQNNDIVFFSRPSLCTQDGDPITYFPNNVSMRKGDYACVIYIREHRSYFFSTDPQGMSRAELEFVLEEYRLFVKRIHKNISDDHFLHTTLPEKIRKDYDAMATINRAKSDD